MRQTSSVNNFFFFTFIIIFVADIFKNVSTDINSFAVVPSLLHGSFMADSLYRGFSK